MKPFNTIWNFFKIKQVKNPLDGKSYHEQITFLIKSIYDFEKMEIKNLKNEATSNFYHDKLPEIKELVKKLEFKKIEDQYCVIPKTFDDLTYFSFTAGKEKKYVAMIYDSDELWQDPQILDIISVEI